MTSEWSGHFQEGDGWVTNYDEGEFAFTMWVHEPSHRCVTVMRSPRKTWVGPVWGAEPASKDANGFHVTCRIHDEHGNPIEGEGFWVESFALAIKLGRKYREAVIGQRYLPTGAVQLTLDDAMGTS
jgi:hypothetical protein